MSESPHSANDEPTSPSPSDADERVTAGVAEGRVGAILSSDEFSFQDAVGGWRGFFESVAPGIVFVVLFLTEGGMKVPVIAAVITMVILVIVRLIQRSSIQQALAGSVGVAIGAIWAWRTGDATDYFTPGLWINGIYAVGVIVSMLVKWPAVGIVMGALNGDWKGWRSDPALMRVYQRATAVVAGLFLLRLAVQVPLALADQTAALGTARLAMGVPLFALTLWVVWLMVRNATPRQERPAPPQQTQ